MCLYREYLDAKADLFSKELAFRNSIEEWFRKHETLLLMQPIDMVDSLTMDHFTITSQMAFEKHLHDFEETFEVECIRIHHQEILTPMENEVHTLGEYHVKHVWKFHFRRRTKKGDR